MDFKCLCIFLIIVLYRIVFYFLWKEMEKVTQEKSKTVSGRDKKLIYSVWKQYKKTKRMTVEKTLVKGLD